jgi:hypothetical protein
MAIPKRSASPSRHPAQAAWWWDFIGLAILCFAAPVNGPPLGKVFAQNPEILVSVTRYFGG